MDFAVFRHSLIAQHDAVKISAQGTEWGGYAAGINFYNVIWKKGM
jgi:hypothetical protein